MQLVQVPMIIDSAINSYKCSYVYIKENLPYAELNPTTPRFRLWYIRAK